ncbi:MAG: intradiol ring-cleavage dioxygenase [Caldilineaceae bacterium]|nr:intradiol ring-cleavage dioxygenase [Caldilineaceae bacterium]
MEKHNTEQQDIYDLGLTADLAMWRRSPIDRRRILKMGMFGISALLVACQMPNMPPNGAPPSGGPPGGGAPGGNTITATSISECLDNIPSETAGPYPADGSSASNQQLNILDQTGIVRSDIRTSLSTQNVAAGVPMTLELTLVNTNAECAPLAGYAIYAWHCTREGGYSMYSEGLTDEDFLRGVQATDSEGKATFTSIFPGCYMGRWPHVHFEIYASLEEATGSSNAIHTSQLAFPEDSCNAAYATEGYSTSVRNLSQITLATDNIFSDGYAAQMATVTGNVTDGYTVKLSVGIAV